MAQTAQQDSGRGRIPAPPHREAPPFPAGGPVQPLPPRGPFPGRRALFSLRAPAGRGVLQSPLTVASPPRLPSSGPSPPQHPPRTPVEGRPTPKHPAVVCHSVPCSGSPSLPEATGTVIRLSDGHSHCRKATWPRPGLWLSRGPG